MHVGGMPRQGSHPNGGLMRVFTEACSGWGNA